MTWTHREMIAAELVDPRLGLPPEAAPSTESTAPCGSPPERSAVDCPDCGSQASIPEGGRCSVCQLDFQDLVDADVFLDRVRAEAAADAALPSPRAPSIPKDGRNG